MAGVAAVERAAVAAAALGVSHLVFEPCPHAPAPERGERTAAVL